MQEIVMDAENWRVPDDVYDAFFQAVGAPNWHGRNFNALRDSIAVGHVNKIDVPYLIKIKHYAAIGSEAIGMARDFVNFIRELHASGSPVDIEVEN